MNADDRFYRNFAICRDRRAGLTYTALAAKHRLSKSHVKSICLNAGLATTGATLDEARLAQIRAARKHGATIRAIATEHHICPARVQQICIQHQLASPNTRGATP